jgi:hypothetical protein
MLMCGVAQMGLVMRCVGMLPEVGSGCKKKMRRTFRTA